MWVLRKNRGIDPGEEHESQAENGLWMERRDLVPKEEEAKAGYQLDVRNKREERVKEDPGFPYGGAID